MCTECDLRNQLLWAYCIIFCLIHGKPQIYVWYSYYYNEHLYQYLMAVALYDKKIKVTLHKQELSAFGLRASVLCLMARGSVLRLCTLLSECRV